MTSIVESTKAWVTATPDVPYLLPDRVKTLVTEFKLYWKETLASVTSAAAVVWAGIPVSCNQTIHIDFNGDLMIDHCDRVEPDPDYEWDVYLTGERRVLICDKLCPPKPTPSYGGSGRYLWSSDQIFSLHDRTFTIESGTAENMLWPGARSENDEEIYKEALMFKAYLDRGHTSFLGQESNPASAEKLEKMMDNLYMMYTPAEEWGYKIIRTSSEATPDREVKLLPSWANSWFKGPARTWSYQFVNDIMSKLNFSSNPDILDLLHRLAWSDPRDCDLTRVSESNLIELPSADSRLEPHLTSDTDSICNLLEELEETLTHLEPESGETGFFSMDSIGLESENGEPGEPCANGTEPTHNVDHELASLLDTNPEKDWGYQQSGGGSSDSSVKEIFKDITNLAIGE